MDDKKTIVDFAEGMRHTSKEADEGSKVQKRTFCNRKRIIVTSVVLTILFAIILSVAFILFSFSTKILLQAKKQFAVENKLIDEELHQDTVDRWSYYHVQDNDTELWVVYDYDTELQIMKYKKIDDTYECLVSPADYFTVQYNNNLETQSNTSDVIQIDASDRPIQQKFMLGSKGYELCGDVYTYWMLSSCDTSGSKKMPSSRKKRQSSSCIWQWSLTDCRYWIPSWDPFARQYYLCYWIWMCLG